MLVALIVLTALVLGGVALLNGRDDPPDAAATDPGAATTTEPAPETPSETAEEATSTPTPEALPAVRVGADAFVYACRLLPREDVERIFGAFGAESRTRQTYLTRPVSSGEPVDPATRAGTGLTTSCDYTIGDAAGHTLEVDVVQYPTAKALARRWAALRSDGTAVARSDGTMLSLPDRRSFVMRTDPVLVEVRYSTFGDLSRKRPMAARERAWQVARMLEVQAVLDAHNADGSALEGPQPVSADSPPAAGGTPYLEPCQLLTDAVFEAAGGPKPGPVDVDSSYLPRDAYTDVPVASCERRGTARGLTTFAVLEVRTAADPTTAQEVQAKHLDNRYRPRNDVRTVRTDAGTGYVADLGGFPEWPWRSRSVQMVVGPYEVHLSVLQDVTDKRPYGRWVSVPELVAAADELVAALAVEGVTP